MSNIQNDDSTADSVIQVIHKKYKKFKTLVLKLTSNDLHSDQLDEFVDKIIIDLQHTLLSNINDLRERVKQARPDPNDPQYDDKMIVYRELLEQMIPLMKNLQNVIHRTLDELHILVGQLWHDISINNGRNVDRLLEEHQCRIEVFINQRWMKDINQLEIKLDLFNQIS